MKHVHKRPTKKEKAAAAKAAAEKIFLDFHEGSSWAHDKVRSGTAALNPEAVRFMQTELARRADMKAHAKELADENAAIDLAAKLAANAEAEA